MDEYGELLSQRWNGSFVVGPRSLRRSLLDWLLLLLMSAIVWVPIVLLVWVLSKL